jgi:hypothetical protein
MKKTLIERLRQYGIAKEEATPIMEEARKLIISERAHSVRRAIKIAGYDIARRLYGFHMYYEHMQGQYYAARDFDEKYARLQERSREDGKK